MHHLLLASTQTKMEPCDSKQVCKTLKALEKNQYNFSSNKNKVLCKYCHRTANNGIRCLGMCVADNDY